MTDGTTVVVWRAPLDVGPAGLEAMLDPSERARAARFRSAADARRFAASRGWLRLVLGAELGVAPGDVPLHTTGPGAKPALLGGGRAFNLSRSGDLALVAVAPFEVGVDLEHEGNGPGGAGAARIACTPAELADLHRLAPHRRGNAFLALWTAKEAFLKAVGTGLAVEPQRVAVGCPPPPDVAVLLDGRPTPWSVRRLAPPDGWVGAVAAAGSGWTVEERDVAELADLPAPTGRGAR